MSYRNTPASFWARVDKTGQGWNWVGITGCWNWKLSVNSDGYGSVKYQGRTVSPHILAYTLTSGPLPEGMEIHHTCFNRRCCNPAHFRLLTHAEHLRLHRRLRQPTHCKHGHEWNETNTRTNRKGYHYCAACMHISQRRYDAAHPRKR